MAYRIRRTDKSVEVAVRRIAREQLTKALDAVDHGELSSHDVHAVRLRCKKVRALLRLVRPCFDRYVEQDARLRGVAKNLAPVRERHVLNRLTASLLTTRPDSEAARLAASLSASDRDAGIEPAMPELTARVRKELQEAYDGTPAWRLNADGWDAVEDGLKMTYRAARAKLDKAMEHPTSENFHALRSHSKYHLFHTSLLVRLAPGPMRRRSRKLDRLCELLGDDHDLSMLKHALISTRPEQVDQQVDRRLAEVLLTLIRRQQAVLQPQAIHLSKRLFAEPPKKLVQHWGKRWEQWR